MWREKAIKWGWWVLALNLLISLLNIGFGYGHLLKHEYWSMSFSWVLTLLNGYVAYTQFKSIKRYKQELKELMWKTLATPSEALR